MQMMKDKKKKYIAWLFFLGVIIGYHLLMREYRGDSINTFSKYLENNSLYEILVQRYNLWTSRVIIEIPLILLSHNMHIIVWKVCDIAVWIALAWSLMYLTHHKNDGMVLGLILVYPVIEMASAGWMPTTINYLWPLTAGCIALVSLDKMYFGKKIYMCEAIGYLAFELFATNFETVGVMYGCILVWYAVHFCIDRRPKIKELVFWVLQILIAAGNVLFALTCPGNNVRKHSEIGTWMKEFAQWTVIDKFVVGVNTTLHGLTDSNIIFLIFSMIILVVCICYKKYSNKIIIIGVIPVIFCLTRTLLKPVIGIYFPVYNEIFDSINKIDAANYSKAALYFPFIIYIILLIAIMVALVNIAESIGKSLEYIVLFISGILTRVIIGFSPTLYVSGNRTFIYLDFVMIYLCVSIFSENKEKMESNPRLYALIRHGFMCLMGIAIIGNLISINN